MKTPILEQRAALRKRVCELRESLRPEQVNERGSAIAERALAWVEERDVSVIFTYLDIPNEVPTQALAAELLRRGKHVFVPRVVSGSPAMTLHEIHDFKRDLKRGLWGIPTPRLSRCPERDAREVEVAFVPCIAVDANGYRLGHGGGYYDRFLTANPHVVPVGLAFEIQRVETVHPQTWDAPLRCLITESGIHHFDAQGEHDE